MNADTIYTPFEMPSLKYLELKQEPHVNFCIWSWVCMNHLKGDLKDCKVIGPDTRNLWFTLLTMTY